MFPSSSILLIVAAAEANCKFAKLVSGFAVFRFGCAGQTVSAAVATRNRKNCAEPPRASHNFLPCTTKYRTRGPVLASIDSTRLVHFGSNLFIPHHCITMGKSIRSKNKRANRSEFRQTHGKKFIDEQQAAIQEKLRECTDKGTMNSFDRLSAMLDTDPSGSAGAVAMDGSSSPLPDAPDAMDTSRGLGTKSADKMPVKAKLAGKKKHMIDSKGSVIGAKIARKKVTKMKRRGTAKNGVVVQRKRSTKSRKKNTCSF